MLQLTNGLHNYLENFIIKFQLHIFFLHFENIFKKDASYSARRILLLQDGTFFKGKAFGKAGTATGEICFNTGMTGYQEVFTDPSYYGQVLIMNNVHIGNYGINQFDQESTSVKIRGLIGRNLEDKIGRAHV